MSALSPFAPTSSDLPRANSSVESSLAADNGGVSPDGGEPRSRGQKRFAKLAWIVLIYAVFTVLLGAFVRSSVSGDGCGTSWPLCDGGTLLPHMPGLENVGIADLFGKLTNPGAYAGQIGEVRAELLRKIVEFSHRSSTLPLVLGVVALFGWGRFAFPRKSLVRVGTGIAVLFIVFESLIGAVLVKKGLVTNDASQMRALMMPVHLISTFVLLTGLSMTAWYSSGKARLQLRDQGALGGLALLGLALTLWVSLNGSFSALGGMIYHYASHQELFAAATAPDAPFLVAAKVRHPYGAAGIAMVLSLVGGLLMHLRPSADTRRFAYSLWFLLTAQMLCGIVSVLLMAPPYMQILHLALADVLWIDLVLLCASALAVGVPHVEMQHIPRAVLDGARATTKDYVALTKPRVISLLLFTTLMGMFIAAGGWPGQTFLSGLWLLVATGAGLYAAAGSSNAINMVCERDLDVRMERTASRPCVTERIHPRAALWFAFGLEAFSFGLLWWSANLLAATLALAGLVVYVNVYTLLLKRRTWSNIVIGGAAGAFPPLVGFAAVSNDLTPLAWLLFALVFVWTPVHFWALAILIKDDYAKAGVPMLPVVKGNRYTVAQIALYGVVTVTISMVPLWFGLSWVYAVAAVVLNVLLARGCLTLWRNIDDRKSASGLFHYSMIYLALLFLAMAVDKSVL